MASTIQRTTKSGQVFYEIQVSRGRGRSKLTKRWYPPDGWGKRAIEKELAKAAAEFERQVNDGEVVSRTEQQERDLQQKREAAKILTLREYGETVFMPAKTVTISENSRCSFQSNLDNHIYPALGDLKIPDITPANISALLLSIQSQGRAHATVVKVYTVLNTLFKMAYLNDAIEKNPMDKVQRPKPRKGEVQGEVEAYTVEEVRCILDGLEKEPLKWRVFLRLLIDTGIRRGECCALQWKDIDFKAGTVTICGNLCYTPHKGVYLDTPKSGKSRTIDVDPDVLRLLRQLQSEQAGSCISPWVFTQTGKPDVMNPQTPTRYFKRFSQRYGIKDFHPHKLRHTFASIAITSGQTLPAYPRSWGIVTRP